MKNSEHFYDVDQLKWWGHILEEWLEVRDRYAIIPPTMDKHLAKKMIEARALVEDLVDKLKRGKESVMKDPDDIDPLSDLLGD